jgi:hypothetical protein
MAKTKTCIHRRIRFECSNFPIGDSNKDDKS